MFFEYILSMSPSFPFPFSLFSHFSYLFTLLPRQFCFYFMLYIHYEWFLCVNKDKAHRWEKMWYLSSWDWFNLANIILFSHMHCIENHVVLVFFDIICKFYFHFSYIVGYWNWSHSLLTVNISALNVDVQVPLKLEIFSVST